LTELRGLVQFTCPTVFFHNLCPSFLWSTSWPSTLHFILHTLLHPTIIAAYAHYDCNLFCCSTETTSPNPSLSLNPLLTSHIHLTILISARSSTARLTLVLLNSCVVVVPRSAGFVVFYDFVGGLERSYPSLRLLSSLYRGTTAFGHPAVLYVSTTMTDRALGVVAVVGAKQPILPYVDPLD